MSQNDSDIKKKELENIDVLSAVNINTYKSGPMKYRRRIDPTVVNMQRCHHCVRLQLA